jgi:hypothetical protein
MSRNGQWPRQLGRIRSDLHFLGESEKIQDNLEPGSDLKFGPQSSRKRSGVANNSAAAEFITVITY